MGRWFESNTDYFYLSFMCKKRKYKDLISVMFALSQCKKVGKFNPIRNEKRYYYCEECKCYHLTSKEKSYE